MERVSVHFIWLHGLGGVERGVSSLRTHDRSYSEHFVARYREENRCCKLIRATVAICENPV